MENASGRAAATASGPDPLALSAARAASRLARQVVAPLSKTELGLSQYRVLVFLSEEGLAPSDLAGRLDVTRPSVTALMDGLVCRDLVERRPDPDDGRRVTHHLTEAGHAALRVADTALVERLAEIGTFLTPEEAETVARGLDLFGEALRAERRSGRMV
ncbi:MAG: MarR family transcriptional regulator [Acidimicrobiia bacterium]|nr:MarR family transcriptional regulator [Actinomycetota bacterium]MBL6924898.1 MarR family transcriptional regulator [Acidimicrobiia bacterium]MBL6927066.1 MarR family transcriptional regulator [Acidimicrobiia bacterium]